VTLVILQPVGDPRARQHYEATIERPVNQERLGGYLSLSDMSAIGALYGSDPAAAWGVTPGGRQVNRRKWDRIAHGDIVLMARNKLVFASGTVTYKTHNRALALDLWGADSTGATWEYMYFLSDIAPRSIPNVVLNRILGYKDRARVQGFTVLDQAKSDALLDSLDEELSDTALDVRLYLDSLQGQTLHTLTGKPNRIVSVGTDGVVVGTDRSPKGELVPLDEIRSAARRLLEEGEVRIDTDTVGFRSAFVGAVLASLPGASRETTPRRVSLRRPERSRRLWREPPEILEALEAIDALAGRTAAPAARLRRLGSANKIIERHAILAASRYFSSQGWTVYNVGAVASYDLHCVKGPDTMHIEVKGTTSQGERVLLTRNEVRHARGTKAPVALYILSEVQLVGGVGGALEATGGVERVVNPWTLADHSLEPIGYEYTLQRG
jgi:hypothetical protein